MYLFIFKIWSLALRESILLVFCRFVLFDMNVLCCLDYFKIWAAMYVYIPFAYTHCLPQAPATLTEGFCTSVMYPTPPTLPNSHSFPLVLGLLHAFPRPQQAP